MTSIKLSKRLSLIASMIDEGSLLADIGCDHALLDIYLLNKGIIKKAIACDIAEGSVKQAYKNVLKNKIKNIDIRLSDGLSMISYKDKIDTMVMSGLGDQKIIKIIDRDIDKIKYVNSIIIQSNVGVSNIRKYFTGIGYFIADEKLIKERNIIYTIIKFKKGYKKYNSKQIKFGPILLKNKDNIFNELLSNFIEKNNNIIKQIPKYMIIKKLKLKLINILLKKEMNS